MNTKLVIFDMDGTVLDTLSDLLSAMNFSLGKHGYPAHTLNEMKTFVGSGLYMMAVRALPEGTDKRVINAVFADFKAQYASHLNIETAPYPGIVSMMETLREHGIKMGISSNKFQEGASLLSDCHFGSLIGCTVGESLRYPKKPDPAGTNAIVSFFGAKKENTLYIGDSDVDILTAQNASLPMICVSWGFRPKEELLKAGAKTIADTPEELTSAILAHFEGLTVDAALEK